MNNILISFISLFFAFVGPPLHKQKLNQNFPALYKLSGEAKNYTANASSGVILTIASEDGNNFQGQFSWDNINLVGSAKVCGELISDGYGLYSIRLTGLFECGGIGGWPKDTNSDFTASFVLDIENSKANGHYFIHKGLRLDEQFGKF